MRVDVHSTMEDLPGLLARDYGFKSQARSASMSASRGVPGANATSAGSARSARSSSSAAPSDRSRSAWDPSLSVDSLLGDHGPGFFGNRSSHDRSGGIGAFDEFYTKPSSNGRPPSSSSPPSSSPSFGYDDILGGFKDPATKASSGPPVYDKPVYDEDMFDGLPGVKSSSAGLYEDVFATSAPKSAPPSYDDLLDNLGRKEPELKSSVPEDMSVFDDLIPGFGGVSAPQQRGISKTDHAQSSVPSSKSTSSIDDPFVVLESSPAPAHSSSGLFTDPIEHIEVQSGGMKFDESSVGDRGVFDNIDVFDGFPKSDPIFSSEMRNNQEGPSSQKNTSSGHPAAMAEEPSERSSVKKTFENDVPKTVPVDGYQDSHETVYEMPTNFTESVKSFNGGGASTRDVNALKETKFSMEEMSPESQEHFEMADDAWLTVSEVPLFTEPTSAPPPSRQPPPLVIKHASFANTDRGSSVGLNAKPKVNESYSFSQFNQSNQFSKPVNDSLKTAGVSPVDELDDFARGRPQAHADTYAEGLPSEEELETNSTAAASAAAMKEAMDRAELKFKHARGVRERERDSRSTKNREFTPDDRDEKAIPDAYGLQHKEKQDLEREQWDREEKEKEQKRLEKERERELQREREKAREAVERATREARERAAAEARRKAERSAVEKATTEARERAERAAFQRAATEARERASSEARERAERERTERERVEREAVEARERAAAEAREKATAATRNRAAAERAAVERAAAEARLRAERAAVDRANAEARGRAATAAREKQQKNENDMGSFAGMGAPPNSAPRQRPTNMDTAFDPKTQNKGGSDGASRPPSHSTPGIRKPSPTMNIVDDLTSIFGSAPSSGEFQEIDGESEERRRARLERHQRTMGRAAKALADKNERDMQTQREQAERHRIGETLDVEIKRWSAGKEGNLRALLSTLQYILWPECGWQPVSLTDLITAASVKKVYRKATLCIHPDKVQQKGANLQQKYISEKVFDLLKEAWNKLNSEELF